MFFFRCFCFLQSFFVCFLSYAGQAGSLSFSLKSQKELQTLQEYAKGSKLPVFIFFVGTTWCPWSEKMEREVFADPIFTQQMQGMCLIAKVQMPAKIGEDPHSIEIKSLMKQFDVQESPTIVLVSSQGQVIKKEGFSQLKVDDLCAYWKQCLISYDRINAILEEPKGCFDEAELQKMYAEVKQLRLETLQDPILKIALSFAKEPYFYVEQYEKLSRTKKLKSPEMGLLRKKIIDLDPDNKHLSHLHLAMIDFAKKQVCSKQKKKPHQVAAPLLDYIEKYGKKDGQHLGNIEMLLAQFFLSRGEYQSAREYAKKSYTRAGSDSIKKERLSLVEYIDLCLQTK